MPQKGGGTPERNSVRPVVGPETRIAAAVHENHNPAQEPRGIRQYEDHPVPPDRRRPAKPPIGRGSRSVAGIGEPLLQQRCQDGTGREHIGSDPRTRPFHRHGVTRARRVTAISDAA